MHTRIRPTLLLAGTLALEGCCNGPFVYVECMASMITVHAVSTNGDPVLVDEMLWSLDGGDAQPADCAGADTGGAVGCEEFYVPASIEGTYTLELMLDGVVVGNDTVDVVIPKHSPGQCCGSVFQDEREIEVDLAREP